MRVSLVSDCFLWNLGIYYEFTTPSIHWGYYQINVLGNICTISIKGTANMLVCLHTVPHVSDVNHPVTFKLNIVIVSKLCVNMFGECSTRLLSFQTRMYLSAIESLSLLVTHNTYGSTPTIIQ